MKSECGVETESAYSTTVDQERWRRGVVECPIILPNMHRCDLFSKAQKQQNEEAAACRLRPHAVCESGRSAADALPAEKVNRKNNGIHHHFFT